MDIKQLKIMATKYSYITVFGIRIDLRAFWKFLMGFEKRKLRKAQNVKLGINSAKHTFGKPKEK